MYVSVHWTTKLSNRENESDCSERHKQESDIESIRQTDKIGTLEEKREKWPTSPSLKVITISIFPFIFRRQLFLRCAAAFRIRKNNRSELSFMVAGRPFLDKYWFCGFLHLREEEREDLFLSVSDSSWFLARSIWENCADKINLATEMRHPTLSCCLKRYF